MQWRIFMIMFWVAGFGTFAGHMTLEAADSVRVAVADLTQDVNSMKQLSLIHI